MLKKKLVYDFLYLIGVFLDTAYMCSVDRSAFRTMNTKKNVYTLLSVLLIFSLLPFSVLASTKQNPTQPTISESDCHPEQMNVSAGHLHLKLKNNGEGLDVKSLYDKIGQRELLAEDPLPLWAITMYDPASEQKVNVSAETGWRTVRFEKQGKGLKIYWENNQDTRFHGIRVIASVKPNASDDSFHWDFSVDNNSNWSVYEVSFPQINLAKMEDGKLFYPILEGRVADNPWDQDFHYYDNYGGARANFPYFAAYTPEEAGLYFSIEDPHPAIKGLKAKTTEQNALQLAFYHQVPDMTVSGNDFNLSGEAVWKLYKGDWFDAAKIYRKWVVNNASWYPKMGSNGREDTPTWMKEMPLWISLHTNSNSEDIQGQVDLAKQFKEWMDVPISVHWYGWHNNEFDNDYPHYFPVQEAFPQGVKELQEHGMYVVPYINSRLWDTHDNGAEDEYFTDLAKPYALKDKDGNIYTEHYGGNNRVEPDGSLVQFAVMDPSTDFWQNTISNIALRLLNDYGVDGIYLDQLSNKPYANTKESDPFRSGGFIPDKRELGDLIYMDFDSSHGHPLGGGHWWIYGYRKMLTKIRNGMPENTIIASEQSAEYYMSQVDGGVVPTWGRIGDGVPAVPAIYGAEHQQFGRNYPKWKTHKPMVQQKMALQLTYGQQLGWFNPGLMEGLLQDHSLGEYVRKVVHLRYRLSPYFYNGEMVNPDLLDVPSFTTIWPRGNQNPEITTDKVLSAAWKQRDKDKLVLVFSNPSPDEVKADVKVDLRKYGFKGKVLVKRINPYGEGDSFISNTKLNRKDILFEGKSAWAWEIKPMNDKK